MEQLRKQSFYYLFLYIGSHFTHMIALDTSFGPLFGSAANFLLLIITTTCTLLSLTYCTNLSTLASLLAYLHAGLPECLLTYLPTYRHACMHICISVDCSSACRFQTAPWLSSRRCTIDECRNCRHPSADSSVRQAIPPS